MITSLAAGRAVSGIEDAILRPFDRITGQAPVVYGHGLDGAAWEALGIQVPSIQKRMLGPIARSGKIVTAITTGNNWGNATARSRIGSAITFCRGLGAHATDKAVLIGTSHGATSVLGFAQSNPSAVACIVLALPALDLQYLRNQDTVEGIAGLRASIDAAHGVTYPAALPTNTNPISYISQLTAIPILLFYAPDDDISTNYATFASNHGATTLVNVGATGHSDASVNAIDSDTIIDFIHANT